MYKFVNTLTQLGNIIILFQKCSFNLNEEMNHLYIYKYILFMCIKYFISYIYILQNETKFVSFNWKLTRPSVLDNAHIHIQTYAILQIICNFELWFRTYKIKFKSMKHGKTYDPIPITFINLK